MEPFFSRYKNELVLVVVLAAQLIALATQINHAPYTPGNAGAVTGEHVESRQISLARYAVVRAVAVAAITAVVVVVPRVTVSAVPVVVVELTTAPPPTRAAPQQLIAPRPPGRELVRMPRAQQVIHK